MTDRYYIGMHSTDNLNDRYMGSGKRLRASIKKHGTKNHVKEILELVGDRELLKKRESQIVNEDLMKDPLCMNLSLGGRGGVKFHSEETRKKISQSHMGLGHSLETRAKLAEANRKRTGEKRSFETRTRMSIAAKRREAEKRVQGMSGHDG